VAANVGLVVADWSLTRQLFALQEEVQDDLDVALGSDYYYLFGPLHWHWYWYWYWWWRCCCCYGTCPSSNGKVPMFYVLVEVAVSSRCLRDYGFEQRILQAFRTYTYV
jgi:hypothetical protein